MAAMPGKGGSGKGGGSGTGATGAAGTAGAAGAAAAKPARRRGNKELAKQKRGVFSSGAAGGGKGEALPKKNDGNPLQCPYCEKIYKQDGRLKVGARPRGRAMGCARLPERSRPPARPPARPSEAGRSRGRVTRD